MNDKTAIQLSIIAEENQSPIAGVLVEAWDKDLFFDDFLASNQTDENGRCDLVFDESRFKEFIFDSKPDVFFKVYRDGQLLIDTRNTVLCNLTPGNHEQLLEIKVDEQLQKERRRVVKGHILTSGGLPVSDLKIQAFDKDLRNEEFLGEAKPQLDGFYKILYGEKQFRRAETQKADVFVKAVGDNGEEVARSNIIFNAADEVTIDLKLKAEQYAVPSEYKRYLSQIRPLLGDVSLSDLTQEDLSFLHGETTIKYEHLSFLQLDAFWSEKYEMESAIFYGLLRQNLPANFSRLLLEKNSRWHEALSASITQNIIPKELEAKIDEILERLQGMALDVAFDEDKDSSELPLGVILNTVEEMTDQQRREFVSFSHRFEAKEGVEFWQEVSDQTNLESKTIQAVRFSIESAPILSGHLPSLIEIQKHRIANDNFQQDFLASLDRATLNQLIGGSNGNDLPEGFDNAEIFTEEVAYRIEKLFPTSVVKYRLATDEDFSSTDLDYFFEMNTSLEKDDRFDLLHSQVDDYFVNGVELAQVTDVEQLKIRVKEIQRLARTVPRRQVYENIRVLSTQGFTGASAIAQWGKVNFIEAVKDQMSEVFAERTYRKAKSRAEQSYHIAVHILESYGGVQDTPAVVPQTPMPVSDDEPSWESLFGSASGCECKHCRSVLSPAAYMVDILHFLHGAPKTGGVSPLDAMFQRRPDINYILLNCRNSTTPLPYIDLVNEILEEAIAPVAAVPVPGDSASEAEQEVHQTWLSRYQTNSDEAERLRAEPEHEHMPAYERLNEAVFPWSLPFSLPIEKIQLFSKHLGLELAQIYEYFSRSDTDIAKAYLQISETEWSLILNESSSSLLEIWGLDTGSDPIAFFTNNVEAFFNKTNLSFSEFEELLATSFLDGALTHNIQGDPCDLSDDQLLGLTTTILQRVHSYLRLARRISWSVETLDEVLQGLGRTIINAQTLIEITRTLRIAQSLRLKVKDVAWLDKPLLASSLRIEPVELERLKKITNIDLFASSDRLAGVEQLLDHWALIQDSGFSLKELLYLLYHEDQVPAVFEPTTQQIDTILQSLLETVSQTERRLLADALDEIEQAVAEHAQSLDVAMALADRRDAIDTFRQGYIDSLRNQRFRLEVEQAITELLSHQLNLSQETISTLIRKQQSEDGSLSDDPVLTSIDNPAQPAIENFSALVADFALEAMPEKLEDLDAGKVQTATHLMIRLDKVARLIVNLKILPGELDKIRDLPAEVGFLDLNTLTFEAPLSPPSSTSLFEDWQVWVKYKQVQKALPRADQDLADFISFAAHSETTLLEMISLLSANTGWDRDLNSGLPMAHIDGIRQELSLGLTDFRRIETYQRLQQGIQWLRRWQIGPAVLASWGDPSTSREDVSVSLQQAAFDKYGEETQGYSVLTPIMDILREKKRDALVAYLIANPELNEEGEVLWDETNDLYSHFLIDIEMNSCQLTSRIKQANGSIQLFVQRCLMNLENRVVTASDAGHWKQWDWMQRYRVWEANRKVFLYPENWIEPDLRDDKSPFFKEFENALLQGDINQELIEGAFGHYLDKLYQVAYLDVRGLYHEKVNESLFGSNGMKMVESVIVKSTAHIFARTKSDPNEYYYRAFNILVGVWKPWQKIDIGIQGENLSPIVFNNRLFLFWLVLEDSSENYDYYIHWTEYRNKQWKPARTAKQKKPAISLKITDVFKPSNLLFKCAIEGGKITISIYIAADAVAPYAIVKYHYDSCQDELVLDKHMTKIPVMLLQPHTMSIDGGALTQSTDEAPTPINSRRLDMFSSVPSNNTLPVPNWPDVLDDEVITAHEWRSNLIAGGNLGRLIVNLNAPTTDDLIFSTIPEDYKLRASFQYQQITYHQLFSIDSGQQSYLALPGKTSSLTVASGPIGPVFKLLSHPYVCDFVSLNRVGRSSGMLRALSRQLIRESTYTRFDSYNPDIVSEPYPFENIEFLSTDANSIYNWEIFFHLPLLVADRLSKNRKFAEARKWFHYIFDPTDTSEYDTPERYWKLKPFFELAKKTPQTLHELMRRIATGEENQQVAAWRTDPFNPHHIARLRIIAYMKTVVMKYLDNLLAWGDELFQQDTIESINEAAQLYILASEIMGQRQFEMPAKPTEDINFETVVSKIEDGSLGPFSNIWEDWLPADDDDEILGPTDTTPVPKILPYFCIPSNQKLSDYRDTIADRLFKIRNCQNIGGQVRQIPLFEPPIDPALLVRARAAGLSINEVLRMTSQVRLPYYRFSYIYQKSLELCNEVRSFGAVLLAALEKKDSEEIAMLRSRHEISLLSLMRFTREQQIKEADEALKVLKEAQKLAEKRFEYYSSREFRNASEEAQVSHLENAFQADINTQSINLASSILFSIPDFTLGFPGSGTTFGGTHLGNAMSAAAGVSQFVSSAYTYEANMSAIQGQYERRQNDWSFQADLAETEIEQVGKQIVAAEIRLDIARKELRNHQQQITHSKETETFLSNKFTNQELYGWMVGQLSALHYQAYKAALEMAKKAEQAARYELGVSSTDFNYVGLNHWDSMRKGLLAGERLIQELRQMDMGYIEQNRRDFEITKHVSLATLDPSQLILLQENGKCVIEIPEVLFELDFPGHYRRRIKTISITMPCIIGPFANVSATLRLEKSCWRRTPVVGVKEEFVDEFGGTASIATSNAQSDNGVFELNFRDERYLPFEGAGAVSRWNLELPQAAHSFDYTSISDVILHISYTARDGGEQFKAEVNDRLTARINTWIDDLTTTGTSLMRAFSLRQEFPTEYHRFLNPAEDATNHQILLTLESKHFTHFLRQYELITSGENGLKLLFKTNNERFSSGAIVQLDNELPMIEPSFSAPITESTEFSGFDSAHFTFTSETLIVQDWAISLTEIPEGIEDIIMLFQFQVRS